MIYLVVGIFILVSIILIVILFDRSVITKGLQKSVHTLSTTISPLKGIVKLRKLSFKAINIWLLAKIPLRQIPIIPLVSLIIIGVTIAVCYILIQHNSLDVYHEQMTANVSTNTQVNQLLMGERLRPPPPPPDELFEELDAEIATYQASVIDEGPWPEQTVNATPIEGSMDKVEPEILDLNIQDHTTGYSGDMLASHLNNGYINIKNADRNWNKMNSDFVQRLLAVYKIMRDEYGYEMVLLEGYRSPERQARLLRKGTHVTKAGSYKSYHQFGLAADSAFIRNGKIVITEKDPWAMRGYQLYGKVAKSAGLVWGGDWRMKDLGHVELRKKGVLGRPEMAEILTNQ